MQQEFTDENPFDNADCSARRAAHDDTHNRGRGSPDKPANRIAAENQNEGTTDWLLFNYDKVVPGRDEVWKREKGVEGYCSHATIRAGETLKVFVSTEPAKPFKIDFYRMGYYGGKGGRLMHSTGHAARAKPSRRRPTARSGSSNANGSRATN